MMNQHRISPAPLENRRASSSPHESLVSPGAASVASSTTRHSSTTSELNAAPRRYGPIQPSSSPSAQSPSPTYSSYQASRRGVPVNKLIEKFSRNDNGAPVMPAPHGVAAKIRSVAAPPTRPRPSTSPVRSVRASEWRPSAMVHTNFQESPPSKPTTSSLNFRENSFTRDSPASPCLHGSPRLGTTTSPSSLHESSPIRAVTMPSDLLESSPTRASLSPVARLASPEKSFTSSDANSSLVGTSDEQMKIYSSYSSLQPKGATSPPLTHPTLLDSDTSMGTAIKQSTMRSSTEQSAVTSAPAFNFSEASLSKPTIDKMSTRRSVDELSAPTQSPTLSVANSGTASSHVTTKRGAFAGLDFSRYEVAEEEIIGRPAEADDAELNAILSAREFTSKRDACSREKPTQQQLAECEEILGSESLADYDIFTVNLKRSARSPEGSVGVILTSASSDHGILVQNVITGSIADHSDFIDRGDRVFFIQGRSTRMMSTSEARALIKSPAPVVSFVLGRCRSSDASTFTPAPLELFSTVSIDPDRFHYSQKAEEVVLMKGNLGVGLALDGGRGSIYGDRPIVVKRIFEGGSAAKSGRIKVGDQIIAIDGVATNGLSYLEATKTLRSRPEGPVTITIYSRI
uniref:Pro-interleukin-16 n=1 Tax=Ascaris suum TaxID=6253 RepID=F1KVC1_ASCSU